MIQDEVLELQRKVIQASNEYMQMFSRSKLLLQENRTILNQLLGPSAASSKPITPCLTPTLSARTVLPLTPAKSQTLRQLEKLDKIEQVKLILDLLNTPNQDSVQEQSSRCMYNVGKYGADSPKSAVPQRSPAKRVPLVERMQKDIRKREARKIEENKIRMQKKEQEVKNIEKIREEKHALIRDKSIKYLERCSSRPVSSKRAGKTQC